MASAAGLELFPWQQNALKAILGRRDDGKWAAFEACLLVPRQNGKGSVIEAYELANLFLFDAQLIIHSAHLFPTAQEAFRRLDALIDGAPALKRQVKKVSNSHGSEGIELKSGQRIRFMARTISGSGRGFSPDLLVLDEAFRLPPEAIAAMLLALSAQPNPQILYTSSTGYPDSDALWRLVERGRAGGDRSLAFMEWSAETGADMDSVDAWATANPSLGYLFDEETISRERATLLDDDFGRERLGMWADNTDGRVVPASAWAACLNPESVVVGEPVFALDVAPNRSWAAIGAAGLNSDKVTHLEVTSKDRVPDHRAGTDWVIPRLVELSRSFPHFRVAIAASSGAEALKPDLEAAGITVDVVVAHDVAAACGMVFDYAMTQKVAHLGQSVLDAAITVAKKRVEDGETAWVWGRKRSAADITPLYAVTLALWAAVGAQNMVMHPINNVW